MSRNDRPGWRRRTGVATAMFAAVGLLVSTGTANATPQLDTATGTSATTSAAGEACAAAALRVVPATAVNARIACTDDTLTSTIPSSDGASTVLVTDLESGETIDVTGLDAHAQQRTVDEAFGEDESTGTSEPGDVRPMFGEWYIDDNYHAHTDENLFYAIITNGQVVFISWVKLTSRIGLQARNHYFDLAWTQLENRPVIVTVDVQSWEDISFWPDRLVEEDLYGNASYQTQWSEDGYVRTDDAGVFYWQLANRKINDQEHGQFNVIDDFEGPHFRCYKTVPCKYPNGEEA